MKSKLSMGLPVLILMRVVAAMVLILLLCLVYNDIEVQANHLSTITPFLYLFSKHMYWTPKLSILAVPLLVNIALWTHRYSSYVFLRVALYVERIKLYCVIPFTIFLTVKGITMFNKPVFWTYVALVLLNIVLLFLNKVVINALHQDKYKEYFNADLAYEPDMKLFVRKLAIVFLILTASITISESIYRKHLLPDYNITTTKEFDFPYLKTEIKNNINNYSDKLEQNIGKIVVTSPDKHMLLMRIRTLEDEGSDLFIFDTANLENIYRLQTPIVEKANRTKNGYAFTPDNKYIVVGDQPQAKDKIKFQVLELATGKRDDRFHDYKKRLKNLSSSDVVRTIKFSTGGNYFVVLMNKQVEIWDYHKGIPIHSADLSAQPFSMQWLSDTELIIADEKRYSYTTDLYRISDNNSITVENKYTLNETPENQALYNAKEYNRYTFKFKHHNQYLYQTVDISCWDVEKEQKLFTITGSRNVRDIVFHPNGQDIIVFEELNNKNGRIVIWNIAKQQKTQELILPPIEWNGLMYLTDNGKKIRLIGKKMYLIDLE